MPFDPRSLDISLLAELNALLDGTCYDEHHVSRLLGLPTLALLSSDRFVEQAAGLEADPGPLPLLVRLLLLEQPVGRRQAELRLGREGLSLLTRLGIVAASRAPRLVADVVICPCAGAQFVTDRRLARGAAARHGREDRVMYLGADSYLLAYLTPAVRQGGTVLDLCTGCGVHAVLAARRGARAIGTDINRRAVAFARLNAALNGVGDRCTFLTGDLYRPLAGRQFEKADLVLANPPFVASPYRGRRRTLFRDAGPLGEDVLRRALRGLEQHMVPGAMAVFIGAFADTTDRPFEQRAAQWLGPGTLLDGLFLVIDRASPEELATAHSTRTTGRGRQVSARRRRLWLAAICSAGVTGIRGGLLALARRAEAGTHGIRTTSFAPAPAPDQEVVRRLVDQQEA